MGESELISIQLPDEHSCIEVGKRLAAAVLDRLPGDRAFVVHLSGPLGAGKTTFARGMLRGAGIEGAIRSPTYTLLETYDTPVATFVHVDLYRIEGATDAEGLGLREYDRPGAVWLVEWPERVAGAGQVDIHIDLDYAPVGRQLHFRAQTRAGQEALAACAVAKLF